MLPGCCCIANRHIGAERRQLIPHVHFQAATSVDYMRITPQVVAQLHEREVGKCPCTFDRLPVVVQFPADP